MPLAQTPGAGRTEVAASSSVICRAALPRAVGSGEVEVRIGPSASGADIQGSNASAPSIPAMVVT